MIKTPLRYPGGKSKALKKILPLVPDFEEFREPFVGGASVFIALKQEKPECKFWINDLNNGVYSFWKELKKNPLELINSVQEIKDTSTDGRKLYDDLCIEKERTSILEAIRFFVLNRITFSGTIDSGGYSKASFTSRFTQSSIERLKPFSELLKKVKITKYDYQKVVNQEGKNVFIFLDPPYLTATKSKLYGKKGDLHTGFDHQGFAEVMKACEHKWMITYDDCEEIRNLFSFANIIGWEFQYGMNNYKQGKAAKGKEVIITNYNLN